MQAGSNPARTINMQQLERKMTELNDILFSVNKYDSDGDIQESGIFLHFGDTSVKVARSIAGFSAVAERISSMQKEIRENYSGVIPRV